MNRNIQSTDLYDEDMTQKTTKATKFSYFVLIISYQSLERVLVAVATSC